jgi:hypothetical protein
MSIEFRDGRGLLGALLGNAGGPDEPQESPKPLPMQARVLTDMIDVIEAPCPFKVRDLVQQIPGFSAYRFPRDKEVAIVTDVGPQPRDSDIDKHTYRLDMRVLVLARFSDGRKEWREFTVESWRFKKYEGAIEGVPLSPEAGT